MVLNKEIQSQQRLDSLGEAPGPASPRQPRRALVSSESYLQRLSVASSGSLWQEIPVVRNSTVLLSMTHEDQKLQEVRGRAGADWRESKGSHFLLATATGSKSRLSPSQTHHVPLHHGYRSSPLLSTLMRLNCFLNLPAGPPPRLHLARATSSHLSLFRLVGSDCASEFVGRSVELIPSLLLQSRLKIQPGFHTTLEVFSSTKAAAVALLLSPL